MRRSPPHGVVGALAVSIATMSFVGLVSPSDASARRSSCARADSKTLMATSGVRVYRRRQLTYACAYSRGRHFHLGDDRPKQFAALRLGIIRIAGRYVAFDTTTYNKNEPNYQLRVLDARTGRTKRDGSALYSGEDPHDPQAQRGVTDIELKPNGSVAWIVQNPFVAPPRWEVNVSDRTGDRILDTGPDIQAESLASSSSTLYWTKAAQARLATFK